MELSDKTLSILSNFASINPNIVINEGNVIKTVSEAKNVLASATLDAEFPKSFGIYELSEFLSVLSLVDSPRLTFEDSYVLVGDSSGRTRIKYFYSDPDILTSPSKDIIMPVTEVNFTLNNETLRRVRKAASVLGHAELSVSAVDGMIRLSVIDQSDKTSNAFSIDVESNSPIEDGAFNFVFNISNLKMIEGDYKVGISSKLISQFENTESGIKYWVALEKSSKYGV